MIIAAIIVDMFLNFIILYSLYWQQKFNESQRELNKAQMSINKNFKECIESHGNSIKMLAGIK